MQSAEIWSAERVAWALNTIIRIPKFIRRNTCRMQVSGTGKMYIWDRGNKSGTLFDTCIQWIGTKTRKFTFSFIEMWCVKRRLNSTNSENEIIGTRSYLSGARASPFSPPPPLPLYWSVFRQHERHANVYEGVSECKPNAVRPCERLSTATNANAVRRKCAVCHRKQTCTHDFAP